MLRCHGKSYVQWTDGGDAFEHRILPWKRSSFDNLPFVWCALPKCKTLTFWSGDDGASGVTFLPRGIISKAYAY
jgi:hypothetical protein